MAVRMGVDKSSINAPEPLEEDLYKVRVDGFKPGFTKDKTSLNFNPILRVVSGKNTGTKNAGKTLFENMNQKAGWIQRDFVHAIGLDMEVDGDELFIPGKWNGDPQHPESLKYEGPLIGKTLEVYVIKQAGTSKKFYNKTKYYVCTFPDCNKRYPEQPHSTDLT